MFHAPPARVREIIPSVVVPAWAEHLPHALVITRSAQVPVWGAQRQAPVRQPQVLVQMAVYRVHLGRRPIRVGGQPAPGDQVDQVVAPGVPVDLFHGVLAVPVDRVDPVGLPVGQVLQVGQEEDPGVRGAPVVLAALVAPVVSPVGQGRAVAAPPRVRSDVRVGGPRGGANPSARSVKSSTICKHRHLAGCASRGVLARSSGYLGEQA
ncbi:unannotated protein [freshwater metagenome]|uniref:Unannotated protein n=1 Tax=freshwater metagenome TaxID=449393 RepID=A0A6J7PWF9_9ZZZZ